MLNSIGYSIKLNTSNNWHDIYFISSDMLDALVFIGLQPEYTEIYRETKN
jgi:hypothetical protein